MYVRSKGIQVFSNRWYAAIYWHIAMPLISTPLTSFINASSFVVRLVVVVVLFLFDTRCAKFNWRSVEWMKIKKNQSCCKIYFSWHLIQCDYFLWFYLITRHTFVHIFFWCFILCFFLLQNVLRHTKCFEYSDGIFNVRGSFFIRWKERVNFQANMLMLRSNPSKRIALASSELSQLNYNFKMQTLFEWPIFGLRDASTKYMIRFGKSESSKSHLFK